MDAKRYRMTAGLEAIKQVAREAGTTWPYMQHIMGRRKRPSVDLARRMVEISNRITPGCGMTLEALLVPKEQLKR